MPFLHVPSFMSVSPMISSFLPWPTGFLRITEIHHGGENRVSRRLSLQYAVWRLGTSTTLALVQIRKMGVLPERTGLNYSGGYGLHPQPIAQLSVLSRRCLSRGCTPLVRVGCHAHLPSLQSLLPSPSTLDSTGTQRHSIVLTRSKTK